MDVENIHIYIYIYICICHVRDFCKNALRRLAATLNLDPKPNARVQVNLVTDCQHGRSRVYIPHHIKWVSLKMLSLLSRVGDSGFS